MPSRFLFMFLPIVLFLDVPLAISAQTASSGGMLLPGWQAVAEQALGDIRTVALQMHPGAQTAQGRASDGPDAKPLIDAFLASKGQADQDGSGPAREHQLIAGLWQAAVRDEAGNDLAAERIARSYTFASAEAQLARSVYGGPAGGAAYAAWWAYRQPGGTASQALQVGLLVGEGLWEGELGSDQQGAAALMVQRTSLAAALGGLAVAGAGGDEQALREAFFDNGAAVLLRDGAKLYCFSARVDCDNLPVIANGAGRRVDQLPRVAPGIGTDFPVTAQASLVSTPTLPRPQGVLALDQGWTISWQMPQGGERGVLYPPVVLSQGGSTMPLPTPAVAPASVQEAPGARVICERGADSRTIWLMPGDPKAGYVCRAMYQVGETQAILWNALQNPEVCAAKAEARVERDEGQGFKCRRVNAP